MSTTPHLRIQCRHTREDEVELRNWGRGGVQIIHMSNRNMRANTLINEDDALKMGVWLIKRVFEGTDSRPETIHAKLLMLLNGAIT